MLRGLSARDSVHCLPGRLIAIRLERVQHYAHDFLHQKMLGTHLITGDDRVLTAYLLRDGYRTLYDNRATVLTDAPTTLRQFARQRLRWARSSFRETLLAVPWMRTRPYMAFIVVSDVITRWISFAAVALMLYAWATGRLAERAELWPATGLWLVIGGSFLIGSYLRQIPHLIRHPRDFWFAPIFALISMVVLRPIEWYGNLTFLKQDWLTRNTAAAAAPRAACAADLPSRGNAFSAQPAAREPLADG
jgi:hyaluronan synthase